MFSINSYIQGQIHDFEKEGALVILVAKQLGYGGHLNPPKWVWVKSLKAFPIWALTNTRIANTYVIIPSDFAW